jgi:hypothetical protein
MEHIVTTAREILTAARKLIENPENWTKGTWALDPGNNKVPYTSDLANCFCAEGAIRRTVMASFGRADIYVSDLERMVRDAGDRTCRSLSEFNYSHDHAEVLAAFDKAIAELR